MDSGLKTGQKAESTIFRNTIRTHPSQMGHGFSIYSATVYQFHNRASYYNILVIKCLRVRIFQ